MIIHTAEQAISRLPHIQLDSSFSPQEIVRMVLAGGPTQSLYNIHTGEHQRAVDFLCQSTGTIPGYPIPGGLIKEQDGDIYFSRGTRSFRGNEYENEFLGTLAFAGVHFQSTRVISEKENETTLAEMAEIAMDNFQDVTVKCGGSILLFSVYPGVLHEWRNRRGNRFSLERILNQAIRYPYGKGPDFGTTLLRGIAFAIERFCLEQDIEPKRLKGIWREAYDCFLGAAGLMKKNQRDDGSLDRSWFRGGRFLRTVADWKQTILSFRERHLNPAKGILYPTGHCLDAVSPLLDFMNDDTEWIERASYIMAHTIELQWVDVVKEIPALTSAIHAMKRLDL